MAKSKQEKPKLENKSKKMPVKKQVKVNVKK